MRYYYFKIRRYFRIVRPFKIRQVLLFQWQARLHYIIVIKMKKQSGNKGRIVDTFAWTWNIGFDCTENTSKQQKMAAFMRNWSVKMTLKLFEPLSVIMTMTPTLLRQLRRSLQIKKIITMLFVCYSCWIAKIYQSIIVKEMLVTYLLVHLRRS